MTKLERIKKLLGVGPQFINPPDSVQFACWLNSLAARLAEQAVEVKSINGSVWSEQPEKWDAYSALVIGIEPIKRGVTKAEIVEAIRHGTESPEGDMALADRIEKEGIIP